MCWQDLKGDDYMKLFVCYNNDMKDFIQNNWLENNEISLYNICKWKYFIKDDVKNCCFRCLCC